jgi:hypothetical protein
MEDAMKQMLSRDLASITSKPRSVLRLLLIILPRMFVRAAVRGQNTARFASITSLTAI